jgi:hypothetical protein
MKSFFNKLALFFLLLAVLAYPKALLPGILKG